jgi:predicted nuclease of predicted toxin-antitoxin system
MKLLLDENLPKRLKREFAMHEVKTVREMGWNGKSNGVLLSLMQANGFGALLTFDKNLGHQQNFEAYPLPVLVLAAANNKFVTLKKLVPAIVTALAAELPAGATIIQESP